jgi:hypothetical protein
MTSDVFVHPHGFPYSYLRNARLLHKKNSKVLNWTDSWRKFSINYRYPCSLLWKVEEEGHDLAHMR